MLAFRENLKFEKFVYLIKFSTKAEKGVKYCFNPEGKQTLQSFDAIGINLEFSVDYILEIKNKFSTDFKPGE